jgi:hypothetical protein
MKNQSAPIMQHTQNQQVMESTQNQSVNSLRAMYYALCDMGGILTPAQRKLAAKSNPRTERRSSKPKKGSATNMDVMNLYFEKSPARIFHLGKKSDFIASAEPADRSQTVVMINGIPHKKNGTGGYKALTFKSSTEPLVHTEQSTFDLEMYQYLFLLSEEGQVAADMYADLIVLAAN